MAASNAPDLPKTAFTALTRLDENRARAQVAAKVGANVKFVKNVVIWGNHSRSMVPDLSAGKVTQEGKELSVRQFIQDQQWVQNEFVPIVQNRGTKVIEMRGLSSAMSAAQASADHLRDWFQGTQVGWLGHWRVASPCTSLIVAFRMEKSVPWQCGPLARTTPPPMSFSLFLLRSRTASTLL